jgi:L-lactate utilization protein LutB
MSVHTLGEAIQTINKGAQELQVNDLAKAVECIGCGILLQELYLYQFVGDRAYANLGGFK